MKLARGRREEQRKQQQELKKYINYAFKRPMQACKAEVLIETTNGKIRILDNQEDIHKKEREYTQNFMGKGRKRWYLDKNKLHPFFQNTPAGKAWRTRIQNDEMTDKDWEAIPTRLRNVYKIAKAVKNKQGITMNAEHYGNMFTREVTLKELDKYLARTKKNTAPGKSGIRIDHIAALPDEIRKCISNLLSIPYVTGLGYDAWKVELVNWTPKEEGNNDINKRRPLMYYEVLRKVWIGMRVRRVLYIWKSNGIIDKDNFAFLTGLSTMQPLMIKKLILENAKYHNKDLTLIDIDFSKAYDSTEKFAKDMALRRLGFPQDGLDLWQLYDDTR